MQVPEPIAGPNNYPHAPKRMQAHPHRSKDIYTTIVSEEETGGTRVSAGKVNGKKNRHVVDIVSVARMAFSVNTPLSKHPFHPYFDATGDFNCAAMLR